jgi:hypothetical protein
VKWHGKRANLSHLMTIRAVILWIHVLCGVAWVGACATVVVAGAALAGEPTESYAFAARVVPQLNRLSLPLAIAIPSTGLANLAFVVQARGSLLPTEFIAIIAAKIILLLVMVWALFSAWRVAMVFHEQSRPGAVFQASIRRIIGLYGLIVGAGIVALGLGLWLSGT